MPKIEALPRDLTPAEEELIGAGDDFTFAFLAQVAATEDPGTNLFVSPLSASMALGMALAGAENGTFTAMRDALGLDGIPREEIGASYHSLIGLLTELDPSVQMEIGNSVWNREGFELEAPFVAEVQRDFLARVQSLDFSDPGAADVINGGSRVRDWRCVPAVVFTDPEIAWAGLTETQAKEEGIDYAVGKFPWAASGRALGNDRSEGFTKLLFEPKTHRIIGAGIVGPQAGDLIAECALAIEMGAEAGDIGLTIHPHPTLSETVGMAAEVFEGTVTDLYAPRRKSGA